MITLKNIRTIKLINHIIFNCLIFFILAVFLQSPLFAQSIPDTVWTKEFGYSDDGEPGEKILKTSDGGFVILAHKEEGGWILKMNADCDTVWTKYHQYGFMNGFRSIKQTSDGGYIIVGDKWEPSHACDVFVVRLDEYGDTLWTRTFDNVVDDSGRDVLETPDGDFIVTGFCAPDSGGNMGYVVKVSASGDSLWARAYYQVRWSWGIEYAQDGNYVITGTYCQEPDMIEFFLLNINSDGDVNWLKHYGTGSIWEPLYNAHAIKSTPDGGHIICGAKMDYNPETMGEYIFLLKVNADGDSLWTSTYGYPFASYQGYSIIQTNDGGYIVSGTYGPPGGSWEKYLCIVGFNSMGDTLWSNYICPSDRSVGFCIEKISDNNYIVVGENAESHYHSDLDLYVVRLVRNETGIVDFVVNITPKTCILSPNYPNPFNPSTVIEYTLPEFCGVTIEIFDILGKKIETIIDEKQSAGQHQVVWNAKDKSTGMYFYRIKAGDYSETKSMTLIK